MESVETINYEGKKKRFKFGMYRRSDYKKAYVTLKEPISLPAHLLEKVETDVEVSKK